jgi:hypothetical protein
VSAHLARAAESIRAGRISRTTRSPPAGIPILYPSSVAEFRTYGLHAIRLSRYSGCRVAMKLVSALCDGGESMTFEPSDDDPVLPELTIDGQPFRKRTDFSFFPGKNIEPRGTHRGDRQDRRRGKTGLPCRRRDDAERMMAALAALRPHEYPPGSASPGG